MGVLQKCSILTTMWKYLYCQTFSQPDLQVRACSHVCASGPGAHTGRSSPGSWTSLPGGRFILSDNPITTTWTHNSEGLTFHLILGQDHGGPVGEDIWNSAKSLVHEPGGHSTHWHFCEGKPTTVSRSSYIFSLFETDPVLLPLCAFKQKLKRTKQGENPSAKFNLGAMFFWGGIFSTPCASRCRTQLVNRLWFAAVTRKWHMKLLLHGLMSKSCLWNVRRAVRYWH